MPETPTQQLSPECAGTGTVSNCSPLTCDGSHVRCDSTDCACQFEADPPAWMDEGECEHVYVWRGPFTGLACVDCGAEDDRDPTPCCRAVVTSGDRGQHEPGCYNEVAR